MSKENHALLRQRFGTPDELSRHLHTFDNSSLLFFRAPALQLPVGSRVLLDVTFTHSDQQVTLRGQVMGASTDGALRGLWLEFPDTRLSRRGADLHERKQRRLPCDALVQVSGSHPALGHLTDLSLGGARLSGLNGVHEGEHVDLRIISENAAWPSELGRAQVVRLNPNEVGAKFLRVESASRMAITRLFAALQESWVHAPQVEHPAICCQNGNILEPPLPRAAIGRISSQGKLRS